ncbi:MAG: glycoside hydrolase family 27 protein [Caulobacteraceae bacterium]
MRLITRILAATTLATCLLSSGGPAFAAPQALRTIAGPAPTPPMGWNSWDAYGLTIDEAQFRANTRTLAALKPLGWSYVVIDEGWYMADPFADKLETRGYQLDLHGRLAPASNRFPSAARGQGLKPLADWTHQQGLKFGIHIVRGVPKQAVARNLPIADSSFHAADAADRAASCPWDDGNDGVADNAAGQAYYDALIRQYADWGVDYLKVDCIADHPYRPTEIRQIGEAIRKTGRPMVLSLSPGPARVENVVAMAAQAQMWRIADDLWDGWTLPHAKPTDEFPNGVLSAFANLAKWNAYTGPNSWPDADMLPFGSLRPHPGWGEARQSRLTPQEARTAMTLWVIARSPLILGGDLTAMAGDERAVLTNADVIALNQRPGASRPLAQPPAALVGAQVWVSTPQGAAAPDTVAVFNLSDQPMAVMAAWSELGLPAGAYRARELWSGAWLKPSSQARFTVPAHGAAVWRVQP